MPIETQSKLSYTIVVAVALVTLLAPMQALATHNSFTVAYEAVQADEVDRDTGDLIADMPATSSPGSGGDASPYIQYFHENLEDQNLDAREQPADQTGERYHGDDCTEAGSVSDSKYLSGLGDTSCYIGFFDFQWEYHVVTTTGGQHQQDTYRHSDDLYAANPAPGDEYCRGEKETEDAGQGVADAPDPVDVAYTRAQRTQDPGCQGDTHDQYTPYHILAIDTDLLETPIQGQDADGSDGAGATDLATGTEEGSGTLTLPFLTANYVFIFGQPHPDASEGERYEAGTGPFGTNPADGFGTPLTALPSTACGDRTLECKLLTPEDIRLYDRYDNNDNPDDVARVCTFTPQYATVNPGGERSSGPCGVFGDRVDQYVHTTQDGGFGLPGVPPTFHNNLPGWHDNNLFINNNPVWVGYRAALDLTDDQRGFDEGNFIYTAVNPKVPGANHEVWCALPNFISNSETAITPEIDDHGFYGYSADAIDADIFVNPAYAPVETGVAAVHEPVRNTLNDATGTAADVLDDTVPDELPGQSLVDQATDEVAASQDRVEYVESDEAELDNQPGGDLEDTFDRELPKGLGCDAFGDVQFRETATDLPAGVIFDTDIVPQSGGVGANALGVVVGPEGDIILKDPTLLQDGLPAKESETKEGHWTPNAYEINGRVNAVVDTNQSGTFDQCDIDDGQPDPNADVCPWQALWDVYNDACSSDDQDPCGQVATGNNYDLDGGGVGLYFVAKISGPVAIVGEEDPTQQSFQDRTQVLGSAGSTAQHCIVGVSHGFAERLDQHVGNVDNGDFGDTEDLNDLCGDADGERVVLEDAFNDQAGATGTFSSAVDLVKLQPTPSATRDMQDISGDEVCVTGIWSVVDGEIALDTTEAQEMTGTAVYDDCDTLATGTTA